MAALRRFAWMGPLIVLAASAIACGQVTSSSLFEMLARVPQAAVPANSVWAVARYANYEALFAAEGATELRDLGDVARMMESLPLGAILNRVVAGPEAINYLSSGTGQMPDVVGFEWLVDVDSSLEFGDPPDLGLLLGGDFDAEAIGRALQGRNFALEEIQGVPVWHRLGDREISLQDRNPADPFGGHLGAAARIALLPRMIANARSWPFIEAILAAGTGELPSLAEDVGYRALATAVSEPEGMLIQALLFTGASLRVTDVPELSGDLALEPIDGLPWYSHAILADRQEGDDQVHLIGLVCSDRVTAQTASFVLSGRLEAFHPPDQPEQVLAERYGATTRASVIEFPEDNLAIALVEVRYPVPADRDDPDTGFYATLGPLFRAWVNAILRREFSPLW
ncbi:MAG: hypothetical protein AB1778_01970 [Candidatus Bipolaricaulota bacterium]